MIYKVSYVVVGGEYPGGIKNETEKPEVGDVVQIGRVKFQVTEVHEIIPPRDDFQFLHATIKPIEEAQKAEPTKQ